MWIVSWGPFLMKMWLKSGICETHEQYTCALFTVDLVKYCGWNQRKKKKWNVIFQNVDTQTPNLRAPTTTPTFTDIYSNSNCQASSVHYFQTPLTTLRGSGQSEKQPFPYSKLYYICTVKWWIRNRITWASKWCNQITCGLIGT